AGNIVNNGQISMISSLSNLGGALTNNGTLEGTGRISANLNNSASGMLMVTTGNTLTFNGTGNTNSGNINLSGGTAWFNEDLTNTATGEINGRGTLIAEGGLTNQGAMNLSGGNTDVYGNVANEAGSSIIVSGGSTSTFYDDVVHNGSEIRVSDGSQAVFFGAVSGAGAYTGLGTLFFEGDLRPGNSPGLVDIAGDMVLGNLSSTLFEIGGLTRGTEYDAFDIGGTLTLAGELEVISFDLGGGLFNPVIGDSFDLFAAEIINGQFDLFTLSILDPGMVWDLNILTDEIGSLDIVRLSAVAAVPVPPAVWLFASGLLGLVGVARRKRT
ncbi:MAG: hypothetical protein KAT90_06720, partial [Gammaproteobacteria bacterium]|nr:hypothetical protein [Gammaproteobacteria bacterium]